MIPAYSARTARAIGYLKSPFNDLEIYVEDTSTRNAYQFLVRRLLPENVKLKSITQLRGRSRVLEACQRDQVDTERRRLYIIDGDFDHLLGLKKPKLKHLYRLSAYCVENVLLDPDAIIRVAQQHAVNDDEANLRARLDPKHWLSFSGNAFLGLFIVYAAVHHLLDTARPPTVSHPVMSLCKREGDGTFAPCPTKIKARYRTLLAELRTRIGYQDFRKFRKRVLEYVKANSVRPEAVISGKDYLLPLLSLRLRKLAQFTGNDRQLLVQLAANCGSSIEPMLRRRLSMICQSSL